MMGSSEASAVRNYAKASVYRRLGMPEHARAYERRARAHTRAMHFGNDKLDWTVEEWMRLGPGEIIVSIRDMNDMSPVRSDPAVADAIRRAVDAYGRKDYPLRYLLTNLSEIDSELYYFLKLRTTLEPYYLGRGLGVHERNLT